MAGSAAQREQAPEGKPKRRLQRQRGGQAQEGKKKRPVAGVSTASAPRSSGALGGLSLVGGVVVASLLALGQALGMPTPNASLPGSGFNPNPVGIEQAAPNPNVNPNVAKGESLNLGDPAAQPNSGNLPQLGDAPSQPQAGFGGEPPPPQVANAPPAPPPVAPERTDIVQTAMPIPCISVNCDWWKQRTANGPPPNFSVVVRNPLSGQAEEWSMEEFYNSPSLEYWVHSNGYEICSDAPPIGTTTVSPDVIMHDLVDFEQMARVAFTPAQHAGANPSSFGRSRLRLQTVQVEPNLALRTLDEGYNQLMTVYRNGADPSIQQMSLAELIRNGYIWIDNPNTVYWRVPRNFRYFPTSGIRLVHPSFVTVQGSYRYSGYSSPLPESFRSQALLARADGRVPDKTVSFVMDEPGSLQIEFRLIHTLTNDRSTITLNIVSDFDTARGFNYNLWERLFSGFFALILPKF